ncbi:hypothetical protein DIS24_g2906 [Lasiodiplodia hormozganensis]|uniref:Uncharacterized protein n=1 Tax=Lasiodiplodia hormozganensis TaxID=869390 RepID=A0AA39YYI4_9PEZI|nr:hypothetical protein DIS24_g2906 [Lasiodiplodia hormozganensis]
MPPATVPPAAVAAAASNEEAAAAPLIKIPTLTYRNRSDPSSSARLSLMPARSAAPEQRTTTSSDADDAITVVPTKSAEVRTARRQVDWALEPATPNGSSAHSKAAPDAQPKQKSKKKGSSFFSFLAVKEPTSGALEQYAELQRKQAAEKGTAFMAGVSSQKLPSEVPRVNTKWNGLPQPAKPDLKRASTVSAGTLYGARRNSVATTSSSSKASRRSQKSVESSSVDFDRAPPPSLETLSIKSHPRHDSGTGVYEPIKPPPRRDRRASVGDPLKRMSGAFTMSEAKQGSSAEASQVPTPIPEPKDPRNRHSKTFAHRNICKLPSITPKEIAPWAEPAESSEPWPTRYPRSCGVDDLDFITSSPISGAPEKSIEEQIADAERRTASVTRAARMPPSSNAQALARLEHPGDEGKRQSAEAKSSKQKKGSSRFMRFTGKS